MTDIIEDGTGKGYKAKVDSKNRLRGYVVASSLQHVISEEDENAYQVIGTATLASGTVTVLHITNNDPDRKLTVTYLRHQVVGASGGTAFPNTSNYFSIRLGRTYSSGGSTAIAINVSSGSGNTAQITAYQGAPTLTGTANEIDRWYTKADGDMNTFNKEGSLIIPPNKTIEISYIGDHSSGTIYARLSFVMEETT
jgi:hypothetical protein